MPRAGARARRRAIFPACPSNGAAGRDPETAASGLSPPYFEDRGHFLVGQAFEPDEEDRFALLGRQLLKSTLEIAQLQLCDRDRSAVIAGASVSSTVMP